MPLVVGVTFRRVGKVYYFDPGELQLREGDFVIAETARGIEFGEIVIAPREVSEEELVAPLKRIVRAANGDDLDREAANREKEKHALEVCERKIAEHGLAMKLLDVESTFDGSQLTFSFSAEGRIDFRELVKDVAGALKTKIQLHQIGVRDEAKIIGGYGGCGRRLCCASFLTSFDPISMKMAKDQSLFLNPAKFSGVCGKLMCCLRFEHEYYKQAQKRLPVVGAIIQLDQGKAKVIDVNVVTNSLTLETEDEVQVHVRARDLKLEGLCRRHGIACNMSENNCQPLIADDTIMDSAEDEDSDEDEAENGSPELAGLLDDAPRANDSRNGVVWRSPRANPATASNEPKPQDHRDSSEGNRGNGAKRGGRNRGKNGTPRPRRPDRRPERRHDGGENPDETE